MCAQSVKGNTFRPLRVMYIKTPLTASNQALLLPSSKSERNRCEVNCILCARLLDKFNLLWGP